MLEETEQEDNKEKDAYLLFDKNKIVVPSDIYTIFKFLMGIEEEIKSFFGFQKRLSEIKDQYLEMLKFSKFLIEQLKENNINFNYIFKESPANFVKKLEFHDPLRSQAIALFASMEALFFLHIAYERETDDNDKLKEIAVREEDFLRNFLNGFILTEENSYYKNNKIRLLKIDSGKLRRFRNSLTHFYSPSADGLFIVPSIMDEKTRKLENFFKQNKHGGVVPISPDDLYELIKNAHILRIKKWTSDFQNDRDNFKRKIQFVVNLVKKYGAVTVFYKDLNI